MSKKAFSWLIPDQIYTRRRQDGISDAEVLTLPDDLRQLFNQVMRREPARMEELIDALQQPADDVRGQVALLTAQGWLQTEVIEGETHYRVRLKRRRVRNLPPGIWQVLEGTWKLQLFQYLDDDAKADFVHAFDLEHLEAGQHIFTRGDWGQRMYMVDSGLIELVTQDVDGHEVVLARLKPGDVIGEVAVLLGERHWATARAAEQSSVWTLDKDDLDHLLDRSPSAGLAIRREIERRVRGLDRRISTLPRGFLASEPFNPILFVGPGAVDLAQALSEYTGERLLVLDLHAPIPHLSPTSKGNRGREPQAKRPENRRRKSPVEQRNAAHLDSKELKATLQQSLAEYDRVFVAAPTELHHPLIGVIGLIKLVIDPKATQAPWIVAAARRRWDIPEGRRADIAYIARRLCHRLVGLALSGGAARALAHIGVLKALEQAHIPIDMIASTGMGAVVAGLYAAGFSIDELTDLVTRRERDLNPFDGSLSLRLASRSALYAGKRARNTLNKLLEGCTFADLRLPLYVIATDLESGQPVVMDEGPLVEAMEASLALAGLVAPARVLIPPIETTMDSFGQVASQPLSERLLVDGSLVNPMPTDVLAERGAGLIVGASAIPHLTAQTQVYARTSPPQGGTDLTSTWLRLRDQLAYAALEKNLHHTDILVVPQVSQFTGNDFGRADELIAAGLSATQREIDRIQMLLTQEQRV